MQPGAHCTCRHRYRAGSADEQPPGWSPTHRGVNLELMLPGSLHDGVDHLPGKPSALSGLDDILLQCIWIRIPPYPRVLDDSESLGRRVVGANPIGILPRVPGLGCVDPCSKRSNQQQRKHPICHGKTGFSLTYSSNFGQSSSATTDHSILNQSFLSALTTISFLGQANKFKR